MTIEEYYLHNIKKEEILCQVNSELSITEYNDTFFLWKNGNIICKNKNEQIEKYK